MRILIVGGGAVAEELLERLDLREHEVFVVERDPSRRKVLTLKYDVYVIDRDATDVTLYTSDVKMDEIDAVIALTGRNEINLFVLAIAKMYNIPFRIAKVTDSRLAELLQRLGLGVPICQPSIVASMIANFLLSIKEPRFMGRVGEYKLYLITLAETDIATDQKLPDLNLPEDVRVILVFDGSNIYYPSDELVLRSGYQLLILSKTPNIIKYFKG
ncbi:MAG: TrkA family potassium uptake protein [Desulfurococcales archaeon]|nr:TrkA family potassium uptake protein [Desulfurococcales archaeon]